jgi:hypothetical protein
MSELDGLEAAALQKLLPMFTISEAYTDILIQPDRLYVFQVSGWEGYHEMALSLEDIENFAMHLLDVNTHDALYQRLSLKGAQNKACTIYGAKNEPPVRLRVDVSLVARQYDPQEDTFVFPGFAVDETVIEIIIRRHRDIIPLEELKLPPLVSKALEARQGLILLTGPVKGGKTSTAASMLNHINRKLAAHIITIEDPIEYVHTNDQSVFSQKEVGGDTGLTFETETYKALRQSPDVILISELRDKETCARALYAAQSSLVIATTHAPTIEEGLARIVNFFPNEEASICRSLATVVRVVIALSLLPTTQSTFRLFFELASDTNEEFINLIRKGADGGGFQGIRSLFTEASENQARRFANPRGEELSAAIQRRLRGLTPVTPSLVIAEATKTLKENAARKASPSVAEYLSIFQIMTPEIDRRTQEAAQREAAKHGVAS